MALDQSFLDPAARRYIAHLLAVPYPVMERIEQEALKEGQPAIGREAGSLLRALALSLGAKRVLELGTNLGYSALWLADGVPSDGRVETVEISPDLARRAETAFREAGVAERVQVHLGAALDVLPRLPEGAYDLVFLDAVKAEYPQYLDHAVRLVRPGGVIAADNLLWLGKAWDSTRSDADTAGVREYTRRVFGTPGLVTTLAGVEDGMGITVVRPL